MPHPPQVRLFHCPRLAPEGPLSGRPGYLACKDLLGTNAGLGFGEHESELRQQAEEDRLLQEIQLLREEMRIKDSRMEQIEPHRRPHYPPTARLAILELRAGRGWTSPKRRGSFR
jgi:hypothetical protein